MREDDKQQQIDERIRHIRAELDGIVSSVDRARLVLELRDLEVGRTAVPSRSDKNDVPHAIVAGHSDAAADSTCLVIPQISRKKLKIPPAIYVLTVLSSLSLSSYMFFGAILLGIAVCAYLIAIAREHGFRSVRVVFVLLLLFVGVGIAHDVIESVLPLPQPTALCADGTYSYSAHRQGTCSWHGGVREWYPTRERKRLWMDWPAVNIP